MQTTLRPISTRVAADLLPCALEGQPSEALSSAIIRNLTAEVLALTKTVVT